MLNSSKYFGKHAQIRDSFVVKFSSHLFKILVEFKRAHYARIREFHLSTEKFGFSNNFLKTWLLSLLFCSCSFITVVQKTVEKLQLQRRLCRRISVAILTSIAEFPQTDFDTKLVNFLLKLLLPVVLKKKKKKTFISRGWHQLLWSILPSGPQTNNSNTT